MLKYLAAIAVIFTVGAHAAPLEVLCYKQPADGIGQWRPVGGNPVGCLQTWNVVNAYWINQCEQAAITHQQALESLYPDDQISCGCVNNSAPEDDPGGGGGEGY